MPSRLPVFLLLFSLSLAGCERGCARSWLGEHGIGSRGREQPGSAPLNAFDCPDGLARCSGGVVKVSRLTTIPQPCQGTPEQCACPWERAGDCENGCVVDGLDVIMEREKALRQLCAPGMDAGALARPMGQPSDCDEEQLYRCAGGLVVACAEHAVVGACFRGCTVEGASLGGELAVSREEAFAILCSR